MFGETPSNCSDKAWKELLPKQGGFFKHPDIAPERSAFSVLHRLHYLLSSYPHTGGEAEDHLNGTERPPRPILGTALTGQPSMTYTIGSERHQNTAALTHSSLHRSPPERHYVYE